MQRDWVFESSSSPAELLDALEACGVEVKRERGGLFEARLEGEDGSAAAALRFMTVPEGTRAHAYLRVRSLHGDRVTHRPGWGLVGTAGLGLFLLWVFPKATLLWTLGLIAGLIALAAWMVLSGLSREWSRELAPAKRKAARGLVESIRRACEHYPDAMPYRR